jgi:PLP dependent protein
VSSLGQRLAEIEERILAAAIKAARPREEIELVVVTKNHPASLVLELLDLGCRSFGENRDQEAKPKAQAVAEAVEASGHAESRIYNWHFIGQLQSNKVRSALSYASVLHSVDRQSLLDAIIKVAAEHKTSVDMFIQLNLTDDPGRGGIEVKDLKPFAEQVLLTPNLNLLGVMGVASLEEQPERDFATIQAASLELQHLAPEAKYISAGMSEDFEAAIAFGATHLRIGSAITGKRQY